MKASAIRSHLSCINNNLGWAREAASLTCLPDEHCPNREQILRDFGADHAIAALLCNCERACVAMRTAYNRRDLNTLVSAARARAAHLDKLCTAMTLAIRPAPATAGS